MKSKYAKHMTLMYISMPSNLCELAKRWVHSCRSLAGRWWKERKKGVQATKQARTINDKADARTNSFRDGFSSLPPAFCLSYHLLWPAKLDPPLTLTHLACPRWLPRTSVPTLHQKSLAWTPNNVARVLKNLHTATHFEPDGSFSIAALLSLWRERPSRASRHG